MTNSTEPTVVLSHLYRTDGSATFTQNGYGIVASVNGPIEVQRRDELAEEAAIDVIVRPAAGVGGTRERHLESIIQRTLRQIILIQDFPRTLIQVTLQITSTPENETKSNKLNQAAVNLPVLPALLQACTLALLSAATPLSKTMTSTILAISDDKRTIENPSVEDMRTANSIHVLAFTSHGNLLVNESEGAFSFEDWNSVYDHAQILCCGSGLSVDEDAMQDEDSARPAGDAAQLLKSAMKQKVEDDLYWKG